MLNAPDKYSHIHQKRTGQVVSGPELNGRKIAPQPNVTLAMIKSDAFRNEVDVKILNMIRATGFRIVKIWRNYTLFDTIIKSFYIEHIDRPYFQNLYDSVSGNVTPMLLELPYTDVGAVSAFRKLIGATNSRNAAPDTIRAQFGAHNFNPDAPMAENSIHGSDSLESVKREAELIFHHPLTGWDDVIDSAQYGIYQLRDLDVTANFLPLE